MGELTDYFRARDAAAAAVVDGPEWAGPLFPQGDVEPFDGVEAKRIEPWVVLPKLVGLVLRVPYSSDLAERTPVRPTAEEIDSWRRGAPPRPVESGVEQLGDGVRDVLASVTAQQVPELAARWATIDEFSHFSDVRAVEEECGRVLTGLVGLSQRAQAAGEHLFCWWSM